MLAPGKLADLVVLEGDPTADIRPFEEDSRRLASRQEGAAAVETFTP
jgi:imidazolonepropionase-like amidohydrolase